jgi:hypothetical protein
LTRRFERNALVAGMRCLSPHVGAVLRHIIGAGAGIEPA